MAQITTTVGAMRNMHEALLELAKIRMPIKLSYRIGRLVAKTGTEYRASQKTRDQLIVANGEVDETTGNSSITPGTVGAQTFFKEWNDVQDIEVVLDLPTIDISEFPDIEISPSVFSSLDLIITDEVAQETAFDDVTPEDDARYGAVAEQMAKKNPKKTRD